MLRGLGPPGEEQAVRGLGGDLKTPDLIRAGLRQPGEHGATGIRADQLLCDPEAFRRLLSLQPDDLPRIEAELTDTGRVTRFRRPDQGHLAIGLADGFQGVAEQTEFGRRGLGAQDFDEAGTCPPAARQLSVQFRPATGVG